jgi:hypothetical protein
MANNAKFVQFKKPLHEILEITPGQDERLRQMAFESLRNRIEYAISNESDDSIRIIIKNQGDLLGVCSGYVFMSDTA